MSIERKGDARRGGLEFFGSAELAEKMEEDSKIRTNTTRQGQTANDEYPRWRKTTENLRKKIKSAKNTFHFQN